MPGDSGGIPPICIAKPRNSIEVPTYRISDPIRFSSSGMRALTFTSPEESNGNGRVHTACFAMPRDETWVRVTEEWAQFVAPGLVIVTVLCTRSEIAPRSRGILSLRIASDFRWSRPKRTVFVRVWHVTPVENVGRGNRIAVDRPFTAVDSVVIAIEASQGVVGEKDELLRRW